MTEDLAWRVIQTAFRASAELQTLLKELKSSCTAEDYHSYATSVAAAIDSINNELTNKALSRYPGLADRIEKNLAATGRLS